MPLNLDKRCISQLEERLRQQLPMLRVIHGMYLDIISAVDLEELEKVLPSRGGTKTRLDAIFEDDRRFVPFVIDGLGRRLAALPNSVDEADRALTEKQGFEDVTKVASMIVSEFESLPWRYVFTLKVPESLANIFVHSPGKIGDQIEIVRADESFIARHPLPEDGLNRRRGLMQAARPGFEVGSYYLQLTVDGFVDRFGLGATYDQAIEEIRSFFGIGVSLGLFRIRPTRGLLGGAFGPPRQDIVVHRDGQYDNTLQLDTDFTDLLDRLYPVVVNAGEMAVEREIILHTGSFVRIQTAWNGGERGARIRRAARWLLDSYIGSNQLLSFVQATVALEILLGEDEPNDQLSLSELLRNRCAYLLGKSQSEREVILKQFSQIYRIRSHIVHRGKPRLGEGDRALFYQLRSLCNRVIDKEISLLGDHWAEEAIPRAQPFIAEARRRARRGVTSLTDPE